MNLLELARSALGPDASPTTEAPLGNAMPQPAASRLHHLDEHHVVNADLRSTARAVVEYDLVDGKGVLIDPDGPASAVHELHWRFGHRVDWPALLATFEAREQDADREAAALIRRLMADG